jgi:hypothetical protein
VIFLKIAAPAADMAVRSKAMLTGIILTRGALEIADEIRPFLDLEDDCPELDTSPHDDAPLEFAVLLHEAAMVQRGAASV